MRLPPKTTQSRPRKPFTQHSLLAWALLMALAACSTEPTQPPSARDNHQSAFRLRTDFQAPLNAHTGWAADVNQSATVKADEPFRLRVEIEHSGPAVEQRYGLQVRRNKGPWEPLSAENFPQPAKALELNFGESFDGTLDDHWETLVGDPSALSWRDKAGSGKSKHEPTENYLRLHAGERPALVLGRYQTHWKPVEFAADIRLGEGKQRAGLVFDYQDPANYHRVDIETDTGLHLVEVHAGQETRLASHPFPVETEYWAELKIIMNETKVTVEYDDEALVFTERLKQPLASPRAGLFAGKNSALQLRTLTIEGVPRSPRVSIVEAGTFAYGDATEDLLKVSEQSFIGGAGISCADQTPTLETTSDGHSEWEFPLVIRRFSDNAAMNKTGDRFDFRLVNQESQAIPASDYASVRLDVPDGLLGGTFVETPMRIGPWQASNGDRYFLMEPGETDNQLMTVKSDDGGQSWIEMDGANRPATGDLEGFASVLSGDRIHMLHQTSDHVFYHVFRTSDHPKKPDTWAIRDERLASPQEPPTQVADLAVRSDGSVVAVYGGPEKIHYRVRSPQGKWSPEKIIDADREPNLSGPTLALGKSDVVHLAYTGDDGTAWYRRLLPNDQLTPRQPVANDLGTDSEDVGSILPLVYLPALNTVSVIYRKADGRLWERQIGPNGELTKPVAVAPHAVVQNAVDSDQTGADAIGFRDSVQVLFIDEASGQLFHTYRNPNGDWSEPQRQVDEGRIQWVRGALLETSGGRPVYGYVYDAGSDGGSGENRYGEVELPPVKPH